MRKTKYLGPQDINAADKVSRNIGNQWERHCDKDLRIQLWQTKYLGSQDINERDSAEDLTVSLQQTKYQRPHDINDHNKVLASQDIIEEDKESRIPGYHRLQDINEDDQVPWTAGYQWGWPSTIDFRISMIMTKYHRLQDINEDDQVP